MPNKNVHYTFLVLSSSILLFACKKEGNKITDAQSANVIVVHAVPNTPAIPIQVYIDNGKLSTAALAYLSKSTPNGISGGPLYLPVLAGTRMLDIRPDADQNSKLVSLTTNLYEDKNYTFFAYDTLNNNQTRLLKLTDDLTPPADASMCKVRFLHLAPAAPNLDITILRTSATPADSITFTAQSYIGSSAFSETALSVFTLVKGGSYTVKLKLAGTQTVVKSFTGFDLANGKTYSLYAAGGVKGTALTVKSIRNF
ncbi:MAG TPA: DUF4397 domain-containing protein [Chitinophagaceae bacterium]|nr:DUF4397 domain-containing protein [Chitinophagaceae bacterium]